MKLYEKVNYKLDVDYLPALIIEYDISKANVNILYKYNILNDEQYVYYSNLDRDSRQKQIGLMQRKDPNIVKILQNGIIEAKKMFFESNKIKNEEVLAIKNDAIFLINKDAKITQFDNIIFAKKNIYTSYYKLSKEIEAFYFYDMVMGLENIDIKGIRPEILELHKDYFLEFLLVCFNSAQIQGVQDALQILISFYNRYLKLDLDIGYYRRFDYESKYLIKPISKYNIYKTDNLTDKDKPNVDISHNLNIMRNLYKIFSSVNMQRF